MSETLLIHPTEARRQFAELVSGELLPSDLARAALLVALEEYPSLDVDEYMSRLDALTERVRQRISPDDPPVFRLGHVHAVLFDEEQFRGNEAEYHDPRNAYLNEVMDRKTGLPISLSIIFLHVARAVGLRAVGVGLPAHYLVAIHFDLNELYVDPFSGGRTLSRRDLEELVVQVTAGQLTLQSEHLRAWSPRQTLSRVLANIQSLYTRRGDLKRAAAAYERMRMLG